MRMKEGYRPLGGEERIRLERLLSEMGMERKLNIYSNRDARTNAVTFGFHTIGLTGGILQTASDEELKGVISHEVGHILHYDFVYQVLLFSMQSLGYRYLYGLFLIPALFFGLAGNLVIAWFRLSVSRGGGWPDSGGAFITVTSYDLRYQSDSRGEYQQICRIPLRHVCGTLRLRGGPALVPASAGGGGNGWGAAFVHRIYHEHASVHRKTDCPVGKVVVTCDKE